MSSIESDSQTKDNITAALHGEETQHREARIFQEEYVKLVNQYFGEDQSPILDIVAWHIYQVTYDIIEYNEDDKM